MRSRRFRLLREGHDPHALAVLGGELGEEALVPPEVAGGEEDGTLREDRTRQEAHHAEEARVVRADEGVVEEKRNAARPDAEIAQRGEPGREVDLLARAGRERGIQL